VPELEVQAAVAQIRNPAARDADDIFAAGPAE
jgi:hypothetical protein